jgi:hypothetical protein
MENHKKLTDDLWKRALRRENEEILVKKAKVE